MGSAVERAERSADMAMGVGHTGNKAHRGRCQPIKRGRCGGASRVAAGQRLDGLAARSGNHIGHELVHPAGHVPASRKGGGLGGSVPHGSRMRLSFSAGLWHPAIPWPRRWYGFGQSFRKPLFHANGTGAMFL